MKSSKQKEALCQEASKKFRITSIKIFRTGKLRENNLSKNKMFSKIIQFRQARYDLWHALWYGKNFHFSTVIFVIVQFIATFVFVTAPQLYHRTNIHNPHILKLSHIWIKINLTLQWIQYLFQILGKTHF